MSKGRADLASVSINSWVSNCSLQANEAFSGFDNVASALQLHEYFLNANENKCQYSTIKHSKTSILMDILIVFDLG